MTGFDEIMKNTKRDKLVHKMEEILIKQDDDIKKLKKKLKKLEKKMQTMSKSIDDITLLEKIKGMDAIELTHFVHDLLDNESKEKTNI